MCGGTDAVPGQEEEWQWKGFDDFRTCPYNAEGHLPVKGSNAACAKGSRPFVLIEMATCSNETNGNYARGSLLPGASERPSSFADYLKWCDR